MDVALVGCVLPGVDNQSLARLTAAVEAAGRRAAVVPFAGFADLPRSVEAIRRLAPAVCGVSIQSNQAALASLCLVKLLRKSGYAGHVVCGGHFATLNAEDILASGAGVDSVVRFAGEAAVAGLARGARGDDELSELPGLLYRSRNGSIRFGAQGNVPRRLGARASEPRLASAAHLGFGAADLITSHGCEARCAYCCVAARSELEARESRRAGAATSERPYVRRSTDELADEIARLHHDESVCVFNVMDDNLLPLGPSAALEWLVAFERALRARRVQRIAFSLQLRADVVNGNVAESLARLGLVRAYVGVDAASAGQLRALGRRSRAEAGPHALDELAHAGVYAVCNALLVGPTFRFESVLGEISALGRLRSAPLHLLPVDPRSGTAYFRRAAARGLAEGSFLLRRFRFEDTRVELLAKLVGSLPTRLAERSVPVALYDLGYNLGIARRFVPAAAQAVERLGALYYDVAQRWNDDQIRVLWRAAAVAARGDESAMTALIAEERDIVFEHDTRLLNACDAAIAELEVAVGLALRAPVRAHCRGRLISAALALGVAACGQTTRDPASTEGAATSGATGTSTSGMGGSADAGASGSGAAAGDDAGTSDGGIVIGPIDAGNDGYVAAASAASCEAYASNTAGSGSFSEAPDAGGSDVACPDRASPETNLALDLCARSSCARIVLRFDANGVLESVRSENPAAALPRALAECLEELLGAACYPSLACSDVLLQAPCWIA